MSVAEKKAKRVRAYTKMGNQISVLSRTTNRKDARIVAQINELYGKLSIKV